MEPTEKDNMQITITGEKVEEEAGSGRKVARDVDIENFTVLDQVSKCPIQIEFIVHPSSAIIRKTFFNLLYLLRLVRKIRRNRNLLLKNKRNPIQSLKQL